MNATKVLFLTVQLYNNGHNYLTTVAGNCAPLRQPFKQIKERNDVLVGVVSYLDVL